jgi:CheY-like chemotaxis protein
VNDLDPAIPIVIQYNKRDLPTAMAIADLEEAINPRRLPTYEAVAVQGIGVQETLLGVTQLLFRSLSKLYESGTGPVKAAAPPGPAATPRAPGSTTTGSGSRPVVRPASPPPAPAATRPQPPAPAAPPARAAPAPPSPRPAPPPMTTPERGVVKVQAPPTPPAPPPKLAPHEPTPPRGVPAVRAPVPTSPGRADATPPRGHPAVRLTSPEPSASLAASLEQAPAARPADEREPPAFFPAEPTPSAKPEAKPQPKAAAPREEPPAPAMPELPEGKWLYLKDGKQLGPVSFDELIDLILTVLPDSTLVYRQGLERWTRASQVPEILEEIPPPIPETRPELPSSTADFPDFNTVPAMLRTVLIADENPEYRKFLGMPLLAQGFRVFEAPDGAEAWRLVGQFKPWLILSDVRMPELDGFELCRRVRGNALLHHRPFLFISGSDNYKDRYRGLQLGADDFLSKQTPVRELLIRIQLLLTRYSDLGGPAAAKQAGAPGAAEGPGGGAAMEGQLEVIGPPGALQICNQGRFTGVFSARASAQRAGDPPRSIEIHFREGDIISATTEGRSGPEAVYDFLAWSRGHFKFVPGPPGDGAPIAQSVEHLLLEGCRLLDEASRPEGALGGE